MPTTPHPNAIPLTFVGSTGRRLPAREFTRLLAIAETLGPKYVEALHEQASREAAE